MNTTTTNLQNQRANDTAIEKKNVIMPHMRMYLVYCGRVLYILFPSRSQWPVKKERDYVVRIRGTRTPSFYSTFLMSGILGVNLGESCVITS